MAWTDVVRPINNITANFKKMQNLEQQINRLWDIAVFLQMIAAFSDDIDFSDYSKFMLSFHDLIKKSNEQEIKKELTSNMGGRR